MEVLNKKGDTPQIQYLNCLTNPCIITAFYNPRLCNTIKIFDDFAVLCFFHKPYLQNFLLQKKIIYACITITYLKY